MEHTITYWRGDTHEVDYAVSHGREIWAIEVESGRGGRAQGLSRFRTRYPKAQAQLVGSPGIPLVEFFSNPVRTWLV